MANQLNKNILALKVNEMINLLSPLYLKAIANKMVADLPTLMLWGAPGIGKSQSFRAIAKKLEQITGKKVVITDVRLLLFNPVDLRGIPVPDESRTKAKWLIPEIFQMDDSPNVINLLFLDELSSCAPGLMAAAYQIVLDRK